MTMPFIIGASQQKRSGRPFIIKVSNTTSAGFTVTLPLLAGAYNYNFIVDWGDGAVGQVISQTDTDKVHAYATGTNGGLPWVITMTGTLEGWAGNTAGLKEYIVEVSQWGRTGFKSVSMYNCTRLVACYGKLTTTQTSFLNMFSLDAAMTTCEVEDWNVTEITNFSNMFNNCSSLTSLNTNSWRYSTTSNISIASLFNGCSKLTTVGNDLSGWNCTKFTNMSWAFRLCSKLTSVPGCNSWDVSNVTNFSALFASCTVLVDPVVTSWNVTKATALNSMFGDCKAITALDLGGWVLNTSSLVNMAYFCSGCSNLTSITSTNLSNWNGGKISNLDNAFSACPKLTDIDMDNWNVSNVTSFDNAFSYTPLTSVNLDNWRFNVTSNFTFANMFFNCSKLTSIGSDLSGWNTNKLTSLANTFAGCLKLELLPGIGSWDVSNVTNCSNSFSNCALLVFDISTWNISNKVTTFSQMCRGLSAMTSLDFSGWDMSGATALNSTRFFVYACSLITTLTLPSSLQRVDDLFAGNCSALTVYNFYQATAPTVSGTPFSNYAKPLHVPVSNSGYNVTPWTNTAIFSSIINDL